MEFENYSTRILNSRFNSRCNFHVNYQIVNCIILEYNSVRYM